MRRKHKRSPAPLAPEGAERAYSGALSRLVQDLRKAILAVVLPAANRRLDAPGALGIDWSQLRVRIGRLIAARSGDLADAMISQVDHFNRQDLARILEIDIDDESDQTKRVLRNIRRENIALIKSIGAELLSDVQRVVSRAVREGRRVEELGELLSDRFSVAGSRADLIARDQTLKANSSLTKVRHQQAGIDRYVWSTSRDERVRGAHRALEGRVFKWSEPPITNSAGDRNHPGEDYQCRCVAIPVLD